MEPGPLGREIVFGETPDLSAARDEQDSPHIKTQSTVARVSL